MIFKTKKGLTVTCYIVLILLIFIVLKILINKSLFLNMIVLLLLASIGLGTLLYYASIYIDKIVNKIIKS